MVLAVHPSPPQNPPVHPVPDEFAAAGHFRFVVLALGTVCLTLGMCNGVALHFTVICMESEEQVQPNSSNSSSNTSPFSGHPNRQQPMFSFAQQGWLFSALALGTLVGSLPLTPLFRLCGFRRVFTLYGLLGGLGTLATPVAATLLPQPANFAALYAIRIIQGFILAISFVTMEKISKSWSPLNEFTLFVGIISCQLPLGRLITLPLAGFLCQCPLGWPSLYYLLGTLTALSFGLFHCLFRGSPHSHWRVGRAELARIEKGKVNEEQSPDSTREIPKFSYAKMLTNAHVWAVFASGAGIVVGNQLFAQYGPIYLKTLGMSTERTGLASALPFLFYAVLAIVAGRLCDRFVSEKRLKVSIIVLTSGAQYFMALSYVVLAILPVDAQLLIQIAFNSVTALVGLWVVGTVKQTRLVEPSHTQALNAVNTTVLYFLIMLVPCFVNLFVDHHDPTSGPDQWNRMFLAVVAIQAISAIISQASVALIKN